MVRNSNIITPKTTINVFNTVAETVNAFGAASNVTTGLSTFGSTGVNSNFNIRSDDTVLDGDLNVNGGEILSSENTFDLLIANNDIRIGAANGAGETVINNSLKVTENVNLENSGTNITIKDNTTNALAIKEGSNTYVQLQTTDASERIIVYKDLYVVGNLDISGTSTVIDTTSLTVEDKNIELGTSGSPTDVLADGGGITLKGTTDKTITYNNTSGLWETNIGLKVTGNIESTSTVRVDHSNNVGSDILARFGNANNSGTNSAHLLLANGYYASPTDVDGTGAAAKILADGTATFATVSDSLGPLRKLGLNNPITSDYTLIGSDIGKMVVRTGGNITVADIATVSAGDMITIMNNSATSMTITRSSFTLYNTADGVDGDKTLAARGLATLVFIATNVAYISGGGLT
jgi:hypothetical protein